MEQEPFIYRNGKAKLYEKCGLGAYRGRSPGAAMSRVSSSTWPGARMTGGINAEGFTLLGFTNHFERWTGVHRSRPPNVRG